MNTTYTSVVYISGQYDTPIPLYLFDAGPFIRASAEDMGGLLTRARFEREVVRVTGMRPRNIRKTDSGWEGELSPFQHP